MYKYTFISSTFIFLLANLFQSGLSLQTAPRSLLSVAPAFHFSRAHHVKASPLRVGALETTAEVVSKTAFDWNEQWYPVIPVSYLEDRDDDDKDKPTAISILGRQLVVWKSETGGSSDSSWSIFDDSCPHRRSPLSTGRVINNGSTCSLRCRYHGWEFDAAGKCSKIPMNPAELTGEGVNYSYKAGSYPVRVAGGLLWVYLGKVGKEGASQLPEIPLGSIPTDEEIAGATWSFVTHPVSYLSMVENSLDPCHAPFTHEGSPDLTGSKYTPDDALPISKYEIVETKGENGGFTLVHTPYQISSAKAFGENSITTRAFIPPCTITTAPIPTFKVKIWFVPTSPGETTVMGVYRQPETKIAKLTRSFPELSKFLREYTHFSGFFKDDSYRFHSQDRITMQGQEQRKLMDGNWWDLKVTPSDKGFATFQRWVRAGGGYGPFPHLLDEPALMQPRELSVWESHGKYCPQCRRKVRQVVALEKSTNQWSSRAFVASALSATVACGLAVTNQNDALILPAVSLSMALLVATVGFRWLSDWSKTTQRRVFGKGDESWQRTIEIFGPTSS